MQVLNSIRAASLGLAALILAGCALPVVQSTPATAAAGQTGLLYALPKAQVRLVAQRKTVDAEEVAAAKKDAADLATATTAAKSRVAQAKVALKDAGDTLAALLANPDATAGDKDEMLRKVNIAKAVLAVMQARSNGADALATAAAIRASAVVGELGKCAETATLAALPHAPDPAVRFLAQHASSVWRDDQLTLAVSPNGLLNSATSVATDQTGQVILSLVQAFAGAQLGATLRPSAQTLKVKSPAGMATPAPACAPYKTTQVFDPTLAAEVTATQAALKLANAKFDLCVSGLQAGSKVATLTAPVPGYVYRASLPVRVSLAEAFADQSGTCAPGANTEAASLVAHVPDASTLFITPVTAAAFTKVSHKHTFKDGMLVEVSLDKPSVVAAVASLPVEILKALVSIPASIIKLRVDYESQSAALATSQANVLKAQVDLLNAQKALEDRLAQDAPGP